MSEEIKQPQAEPTTEQNVAENCEANAAEVVPTKKKKGSVKKIILLAAVLAVVLGGVIGFFVYNSAESVAARYFKAFFLSDYSTQWRLDAVDGKAKLLSRYDNEEEFFEAMSDSYDEDITSWRKYFKIAKSGAEEKEENVYGLFKLETTVKRNKKVSVQTIQKQLGSDFDKYGIVDPDELKDGREIKIKLKIVGEEKRGTMEHTFYLSKIKGFWKVVSY